MTSILFLVLIVLTAGGYFLGRSRAVNLAGGDHAKLHSLPGYYGYYIALWCGLPALIVVIAWIGMETTVIEALVLNAMPGLDNMTDDQIALAINDVRNMAHGGVSSHEATPETRDAILYYRSLMDIASMAKFGVVLAVCVAAIAFTRSRVRVDFRARNNVEAVVMAVLILCSVVAVMTTFGIVFSLVFETARFFQKIPVADFLFGLEWSPQTAIRADQVASEGSFGMIPLMVGTLLISFIAMCVAAPVGLLAAIYMSEYAHRKVRAVAKPVLEILAGVPTVVYGFFAALTVAPLLRDIGVSVGLTVSSESALAAGIVMGIMIIPFVSSLSDDVINAVPKAMREGSYGLGATRSETIKRVVVPAALPGIVAGMMLAISRAIGETMIVVMAAGLIANLSVNPINAVTTVTVQIVTLLTGDQEFDSAKTLAAFALGLVLFCITLCLNVIALTVVNKYREQYE